ncbi:MAG: phage tail protein [Proteobacteria bacterium]|nr:phage tail protein [Pseudomonadota bacterium]
MADCFLGEVQIFAGNFAPAGWALCQGQLLSIAQYDALYNLIGTTYGGDGVSTFALPDLRGRLVLHAGGQGGSKYATGQTGGSATQTLTAANLPPHTHALQASSAAGTQASPTNAYPAAGQSYATTATATMAADTVGSTGGSQPFSVQQPFVGINYIISLSGIYPAQS